MKQKLFMLLAVILLGSASAFAQSGSDTPIKGDVNGDGVVDIADIVAVIDIIKNAQGTTTTYYFSIGITPVTSSNYTTANNATTTIPTSIEYTSTQRVRHYFLIPDNKTLSVIDKTLQVAVPITEQTGHGISNHKLYYTNGAIANGGTVIIILS